MNAKHLLAAIALIGGLSTAKAQTTATSFVYTVSKVDAQHVLISEVMEVPKTEGTVELLARVRAAHPGVTIPDSTQPVLCASATTGETLRMREKARLEKQGKTVTLLDKQ